LACQDAVEQMVEKFSDGEVYTHIEIYHILNLSE